MRQRGLRPGQAGDIEGERVGAVGPHAPLEPEGEIRLGRPRHDLRQQARQGAVRDGTRGGDALHFGRFLDRPVRLDPAFDRHELDIRRGRGQALPQRMRHEPGLDGHPPRPDRLDEGRPAAGQVVIRLEQAGVRRLRPGLDRVARVGQHDDLVGSEEESSRVAGDLLLAIAQGEPGQVAHVLRAEAEIGVHADRGEPVAHALDAIRPGGSVGLVPGSTLGGGRGDTEVRGDGPSGPRTPRHGVRYFLMLAWCSLNVLAKAVALEPSPFARKYR